MSYLPVSTSLPVEFLAACFQNTTNSYKFYWLLSILEHIRIHRTPILSIDELKSRMIATVWYPTVYFNLSFGKQDRLSLMATMVQEAVGTEISAEPDEIIDRIIALRETSRAFATEFNSLRRYVPYRFLEPFFRDKLRGVKDQQKNGLIVSLARESFIDGAETTCCGLL
jgi:hypothetical protein